MEIIIALLMVMVSCVGSGDYDQEFGCAYADPQTLTGLVILAGQSNAVGLRSEVNPFPSYVYDTPGTAVYSGEAWGSNCDCPRSGPEAWSLYHWNATGQRIGVIKYAVGGSCIEAWLETYYDQLLEAVTDARASTSAPVLAVWWMQGESDSMVLDEANRYEANLTELVGRFEADFGSPVIVGLISPRDTPYKYPNIVRAAQMAVAESNPNVTLIETLDLPVGDEVHFDLIGQILLAERFYQAMGR